MSSKIQCIKTNFQLPLINIYGLIHNSLKKNGLGRNNLFINQHSKEHILIGEDFNTILNLDEKFRGSNHISQASIDFKAWIDCNNLCDIPLSNGKLTWNNRRKFFS